MSALDYLPDQNATFYLSMIFILIFWFVIQTYKKDKKREEERKGTEEVKANLKDGDTPYHPKYCPNCGISLTDISS